LEAKIQNRIITRLLKQLAIENIDYRGVLYVGLMITPEGDPYVLEFNARFGDPETQAIVLRAESGFARLLQYAAAGRLETSPAPRWRDQVALYVVAAAAGYPGKPQSEDPISGLDGLPPGLEIFYSGVAEKSGRLVTAGGRVLGLGLLADNAREARENLYPALERVRWPGMHYRRDIGLPRG
jgi:phosphoribosylamine--glycine ligase